MKKKISISIMVILLLFISCIPVFATTSNYYLPAQQIWTASGVETRTGNYSYVQIGCDSVYPLEGADNFKKIQARIRNVDKAVIMNGSYVVLTEGAGLTNVTIKEGYLGTSTVFFQFRGNSQEAAYAVVTYYAK